MADYERTREDHVGKVRASDIEPYTALRWVGTLFKAAAIFLFVAIIGQFIADLRYHGAVQLPAILGELARTIVLAVVLWGGGDLVRLMVQLGNDVRAERILLARLVHRTPPLARETAAEEDAAVGESVLTPAQEDDGH
ncbi:MAG: hypothetical protein ACYC28_11925 [Longimicrobiales bacterium]